MNIYVIQRIVVENGFVKTVDCTFACKTLKGAQRMMLASASINAHKYNLEACVNNESRIILRDAATGDTTEYTVQKIPLLND